MHRINIPSSPGNTAYTSSKSTIYLKGIYNLRLLRLIFAALNKYLNKVSFPDSFIKTWRPFLESPDNKRALKVVVVYIHDRGLNNFADNMTKLSVLNKRKGLLFLLATIRPRSCL